MSDKLLELLRRDGDKHIEQVQELAHRIGLAGALLVTARIAVICNSLFITVITLTYFRS